MKQKLFDVLSTVSNSLSIWQALSGSALLASFALPAWAAATTEWISSYGRIGWVAAGFSGLLVGVIAVYVMTSIKISLIKMSITRLFYQEGQRINPLDIHYLNKRINLRDLLPPGPGIIENKTFENCELVGPLNIFPVNCILQRNLYTAVDYIVVDNEKSRSGKILNAAIFNNCRFLNCKIYFVSFLIMEESFEVFDSWGGCNWITQTPKEGVQLAAGTSPAIAG
ncbi:hypothetical protein [Methylocystis rosea]|uniref:hypothetical protein n=1 Tax=Methylocystis rosea TaxID=173366 RepID=UPI00035F0BA5|nr:hypothetical protein [Methylocystis rosea]